MAEMITAAVAAERYRKQLELIGMYADQQLAFLAGLEARYVGAPIPDFAADHLIGRAHGTDLDILGAYWAFAQTYGRQWVMAHNAEAEGEA